MLVNSNILDNGNSCGMLLCKEEMSLKRISLDNSPENIKEIVRKEIVTFMKDRDLSQYGIGKMFGWTPSYVNQILGSNSSAVSLSKLFEIASKIGIKLTLVIEKK